MNNKFLSIAASTAIVASALVFSGCGDSDSSSTPAATTTTTTTAAGTLTGTAVKGPWSNVTYTVTTNGTLANSTGTMTGGAFSFGTTSDNVTIDLGMAKWKIVNPTSGSMFSFLNIAQEGNKLLRTNGTEYSSTDYANVIDNLLLTTLAFENDTSALESTTTPYNAGTLISRFAALQAQGLDLTKSSADFQTDLSAKIALANLTSVNKTSVATAATSMVAYKSAIKNAYGTAMAAAYNSLNSINSTNLNNTFIIVSNATGKYVIDMTNTGASNIQPASNITTGGTLDKLGSASATNATGSTIVFGKTNTSDLGGNYSIFTSSLAGLRNGSTVKMRYVDANGEMREYTVNSIKTNLSSWKTNLTSPAAGARYVNITLTDSYGNPKLKILQNATESVAHYGSNATIQKYIASTNSWVGINGTDSNVQNGIKITAESGMAGLNTTLSLYNNTAMAAADSYMNLTFDFDPVGYANGGNGTYANGGVIATIVNTIDTAMSTLGKFLLSLFSRS